MSVPVALQHEAQPVERDLGEDDAARQQVEQVIVDAEPVDLDHHITHRVAHDQPIDVEPAPERSTHRADLDISLHQLVELFRQRPAGEASPCWRQEHGRHRSRHGPEQAEEDDRECLEEGQREAGHQNACPTEKWSV